jgi:hypothetical protein
MGLPPYFLAEWPLTAHDLNSLPRLAPVGGPATAIRGKTELSAALPL